MVMSIWYLGMMIRVFDVMGIKLWVLDDISIWIWMFDVMCMRI